jgi:putative FmdB family regulatory protein
MPLYTYKAEKKGCKFCKEGFEYLQNINERPLEKCPKCNQSVFKVFTGFSLGASKTGFDQKAKEKGFHKLKRVDKGKYEKVY